MNRHLSEHFSAIGALRLVMVLALASCQVPFARQANTPAAPTPSYWPTQGWQTTTPEEQGVDSAKLAESLRAIRAKNLNLHSLLLIRNGRVIVDAYYYPYDGKTVHELASVTKSIMTTLIAIAADQGKLKLDQPMVSFFPNRTIANRDARKERITVRHLTGMVSGLDSVGHARDEGTLTDMTNSKDWVQFALDRKVIWEPGTHFIYDSPSTHLLSAILQQATGMTALDFGRKYLFEPLGIRDVLWDVDPQGYTHGWGDIFLHPRDTAKIGYLWMNKGMWEGKQIVASLWVTDSTKTQIKTGENDDYGYGWWITGEQPHEYAAVGRGGQRIQVYPAANAMLVMTAGGAEYDDVIALLMPAFANVGKPQPANADSMKQLNGVLAEIATGPTAKPVAALPATARAISSKSFALEPNALTLTNLRLDFDTSVVATLQLGLTNNQPSIVAKVGLDGVYRFSPWEHQLLVGVRGTWADDKTFVMEFDGIANRDAYTINARFDQDRVVMAVKERTREATVTIKGVLATE